MTLFIILTPWCMRGAGHLPPPFSPRAAPLPFGLKVNRWPSGLLGLFWPTPSPPFGHQMPPSGHLLATHVGVTQPTATHYAVATTSAHTSQLEAEAQQGSREDNTIGPPTSARPHSQTTADAPAPTAADGPNPNGELSTTSADTSPGLLPMAPSPGFTRQTCTGRVMLDVPSKAAWPPLWAWRGQR